MADKSVYYRYRAPTYSVNLEKVWYSKFNWPVDRFIPKLAVLTLRVHCDPFNSTEVLKM